MSYLQTNLKQEQQIDTLRQMRDILSKAGFGVTVHSHYLTLRWRDGVLHREVQAVITDVDPGLRVSGSYVCDAQSHPDQGRRPRCEFDPVADPQMDHCLHCGWPEERK